MPRIPLLAEAGLLRPRQSYHSVLGPADGIMTKHLWIVLWLAIAGAAQAADPSALWKITNDRCVPHQRDGGDPRPCAMVDLNHGYVILKDLVGDTQFLLMPTARVAGIESPEILAPDAPNYWDFAWRARHFVEERAGKPLPRDEVSLAINSVFGRTQDQLHIHIDCVRRDVRDALIRHRDEIGSAWAPFPEPLTGLPWRAVRVDGDNPDAINPFQLLAKGDPVAAADMAHHTLALAGITWPDGRPGFVVLDGKADYPAGNTGSSEVLQDHDCALAH